MNQASNYNLQSTQSPPLIVIIGETASGKSDLALEVAKKYNGEIVSADSRMVYRSMDIGTAKPSKADRLEVRHHLISIIDPDQPFSAADYKHLAVSAIRGTRVSDKLPILVGGTGLYVDAVVFDFSFAPAPTAGMRNKLMQRSVDELRTIAGQKSIEISQDSLKNKRHLVRLIESEGQIQEKRTQPDNTLMIGLKIARSTLRKRIEQRVETMFRKGLKREVNELVEKYGWDHEALTGIGYREFRAYYEEGVSMTKVKSMIVKNTLNYAKRQRTWFKRNPYIKWYESQHDAHEEIARYLKQSGYT